MTNYAAARTNMVDGQIRPNGIVDPGVLRSLSAIPREAFVPGDLQRSAYVDADLRLSNGRVLLEPLVMARMLQEAGLRPDDTVLNLGDSTGYAAALLASLVTSVATVETTPGALDMARTVWKTLGLGNVSIVTPKALEAGRYSLVFVNGAIVEIPDSWRAALGPRGRIMVVLRPAGKTGSLTLVEKDAAGVFGSRSLYDTDVAYMDGHAPRPAFQF